MEGSRTRSWAVRAEGRRGVKLCRSRGRRIHKKKTLIMIDKEEATANTETEEEVRRKVREIRGNTGRKRNGEEKYRSGEKKK